MTLPDRHIDLGAECLRNGRRWGAIPSGYTMVVDANGSRLVVRDDHKNAITPRTCRERFAGGLPGRFQGRGELKSISLSSGESALIRAYRHGGAMRYLSADVFFTWPPRPFRELTLTEALRRRGIATLEVYGAAVEPVWGPFYRGWLITRELSDANDLWAAFQTGLVRAVGIDACLLAAARSVRNLHSAGVYHADLNLKNILLRQEKSGVKGYVIDLDKARLYPGPLPRRMAKRNLSRLYRSILKKDPRQSYIVPTDWERFLEFYHDREPRPC